MTGYSFATTAIDMMQAAEVGRSLVPLPVPVDEQDGDLPPQPDFSPPVQDHMFIEPKYQVSQYGDASYAYLTAYHQRAQPGAEGTAYDTHFLDPSTLPKVDFEAPPAVLPDEAFERIEDARYGTPELGKFGWIGTHPLVPFDRPYYKGVYVVALNPGAALWEYTPHLMAFGIRLAMKTYSIGMPVFHVIVKGRDEVDAPLIEWPDTGLMRRPGLEWKGTRPLVPPQARSWSNHMIQQNNNLMYCVGVSENPWDLPIPGDGEIRQRQDSCRPPLEWVVQ